MALYLRRLTVGIVVALACSACNRNTSSATVPPTGAVSELPPSVPNQPPSAPGAATLGANLLPTAIPAAGICTDGARFVEDLTVPDGSAFTPGEVFDKRWAIRNDGTCDWGPAYRLVPIGDNPFGGPAEIALYPARAGTTGEWQIELEAPRQPGEYFGRWQARAPDGTLFGDEVYVIIFVEQPTSSPAPTTPSFQ